MRSTTDWGGVEEVPFLDLHRQYLEIKDEIDEAMASVIAEAAFVGGRRIAEFESAFAEYVQAGHAVGVGNGTDALEIALEALIPERGGEVVVPANSFVASSEAVTRAGYRVVFADVDDLTLTLDPEDVRRRLSGRTVAVMAVHLYGRPAEMDALRSICDEAGVRLIEDAAQAHGAEFQGHRVGSLGDVACFSFYPGKNLGAYGDAGAIVTGDPMLANRIRMIANHGRLSKYVHEFEGRSSRLDGIQAAILSVKLRHLERWTEHRRMLASRYREGLEGVPDLIVPQETEGLRHVYHLFVVRTSRRDELRAHLTARGIRTGVHYPLALPRLEAYSEHAQHEEPFRAVEIADQILSLPIGDSTRVDEVDRVVTAVRGCLARGPVED